MARLVRTPANLEALKNSQPGPYTYGQAQKIIGDVLGGSDAPSSPAIEKPQNQIRPPDTLPQIDKQLEKALGEGPSSLIQGQVRKELAIAMAAPGSDKVPIQSWLLNPAAAFRRLEDMAAEASTHAEVKRVIRENVGWLARVAADDTKRDALLSHVENLRKTLGPYIEPYCREKNLPPPEMNTPWEMILLLRINAEMRTLQEQGKEIASAGEEMVRRQVELQKGTATNQMLAKELPRAIETERSVNVLKEASVTEKVRHALATLTAAFSGGAVGTVGGFLSGLEHAVSALVEKHPKVAIALAAGLGVTILQIVSYSGQLSGEILGTFGLKGGLVAVLAALATGVGSGLVSRFTIKKESVRVPTAKNPSQNRRP